MHRLHARDSWLDHENRGGRAFLCNAEGGSRTREWRSRSMSVTNRESGTNVHEIAPQIYRISTPVSAIPGGFTFNQILVVDDEPLLFHTGLKKMFPLTLE